MGVGLHIDSFIREYHAGVMLVLLMMFCFFASWTVIISLPLSVAKCPMKIVCFAAMSFCMDSKCCWDMACRIGMSNVRVGE